MQQYSPSSNTQLSAIMAKSTTESALQAKKGSEFYGRSGTSNGPRGA
jgi:hypothetical protein